MNRLLLSSCFEILLQGSFISSERTREGALCFLEEFASRARRMNLPKLSEATTTSRLDEILNSERAWEENGGISSDDYFRTHGLVVLAHQSATAQYVVGIIDNHGNIVQYTFTLNERRIPAHVRRVAKQRTTLQELFEDPRANPQESLLTVERYLRDLVDWRAQGLEEATSLWDDARILRTIMRAGQ